MTLVYENDVIVGFITNSQSSKLPDEIRHYWQTTKTVNTQIERIQGGDSDNTIEGYRSSRFSDEISIIDGGGGNDILYAPGIPWLSNEVADFPMGIQGIMRFMVVTTKIRWSVTMEMIF